jgi:Ca2+-transporting ATPase
MEMALHSAYAQAAAADLRPEYEMVHEYPLSGKPPMMTHIFRNRAGTQIIAAKGAPEAIMHCAQLSDQETQSALAAIDTLAKEGYRLLAVGDSDYSGDQYAAEQQEIRLHFRGIVAFYDPPKAGIAQVLDAFYQAGIRVKIITGDNAATTASIARQIGFRGYEQSLTGDEIVGMTDAALQAKVGDTQLFTRMFPEAKLKIINALKANNEIVAMTGDGVNDGPALKAAHIGIAMGKKGTEIARQAASLILQDDDLQKMVDAIAMGRRIYANLKKAIRYIISIHIPIILAVFLPLVLGWRYPNLFSPVHIIFLEIVMGPTCSIIFENEPMEQHTMSEPPRAFTTSFFNWPELATSLLQGAVITAGVLLMYQYALALGYDEALTRTMVFTTLITANIFLTLVNRSFYYPVWTTLRYHNNLVPLIIGITLAITASLIYFHPFAAFFGFSGLALPQLAICAATGFASVLWYELVKWRKRVAEPK